MSTRSLAIQSYSIHHGACSSKEDKKDFYHEETFKQKGPKSCREISRKEKQKGYVIAFVIKRKSVNADNPV